MNADTQRILNWMCDEQSREIYENRVKFQETYDYSFIQETVEKYRPEYAADKWLYISDSLKRAISGYKEVIVAGVGQKGKALIVLLRQSGFNVARAVDNGLNGLLEFGEERIDVFSLKEIDYEGCCFIISLSDGSVSQVIAQQLMAEGVPEGDIYQLVDYVSPARHLKEKEYFDEGLIKWGSYECFADCGALDLETSLFFAERCKESGVKDIRIHAFEPDRTNYERCLLNPINKDKYVVVTIYDKGVWSSRKTLRFNASGSDSARIQENGASSIEVVALDDVVKEKVTFIKMDIEGAELEALKGAKDTIRKWHPRLAICLYHKPQDIVEIPLYVKDLVPEYKFYVRHYSNNTGELVLYAITW